MSFSVILSNFQEVTLRPEAKQTHVISYLSQLLAETQLSKTRRNNDQDTVYQEVKALIEKYAVNPNYIEQRELNILPDNFRDGEKPSFLGDIAIQPNGDDLGKRMKLFSQVSGKAISQMYEANTLPPSDLVHVSCSGYLAPSPAEKLVSEKGWGTTVTHSYHMGCYGAFPAVRIATGILATAQMYGQNLDKQVDIVHTEYLSLHLNSTELSANNLINATLFGDGFIKYSLYNEDHLPANTSGLKLIAASEVILPNSLEDMTWQPSSHQFDMYLSRYVPLHIRNAIQEFVRDLCAQADLDFEAEKDSMYFAIHPGGPGILTHIQKQLGIRDDQYDLSWSVLKEKGNMSSATVPYIWKDIIASDRFPAGQKIISMAFGPGLTASGTIMEKVC